MEDKEKRIARAVGNVGTGILLSRIFGFIREMVIASLLGAGLASDAFFMAYKIPNLLRRILVEGAFNSAFVPVFTEKYHQEGIEKAYRLANILFSFLVIVFLTIIILGLVFTPFIVRIIAPGFAESAQKFNLTVTLSRTMFCFILFAGLAAFATGILNSLKIYFWPAISPLFFNLSVIFFGIFVASGLTEPAMGLASGVVAGGFFQFIIQVPLLVSKGFKFRWIIDFKNESVKKTGTLMLPAFLGIGAEQINILITSVFASLLVDGSVSYIYYGARLVQFPLGLIGVAMGIAVLPIFSEFAAKKNFDHLRESLNFALRFVLFISIPAALSLILLKTPIVNLAYQRGSFSSFSTRETGEVLFYFSLGLCASAAIKVMISAFYAMQDTRTPGLIGVFSIFVNTVFNFILLNPLKHGGLALATSIASFMNLGLLIYFFKKKVGGVGMKKIFISVLKSLSAAVVMGIIIGLFNYRFFDPESGFILRLLVLVVEIIMGLSLYFYTAYLLKTEELFYLKKIIFRTK